MENFPNTVFIRHSDCENEVETDDEALSLVDLPVTVKLKKKTSIIKQWKLVINSCKRLLKPNLDRKEETFEFSPSNSFSDHGSAVICHADELFDKGCLLPLSTSLRTISLQPQSNSNGEEQIFKFSPSKSISDHGSAVICHAEELCNKGRLLPVSTRLQPQNSTNSIICSNLGSIVRLENDVTSQVMTVTAQRQRGVSASSSPLSPRRLSSSSSFKWQHLKGGLLSIPASSSPPFSIDKLRKSQRSSSSSISILPSQWVHQGQKKRNGWKIIWWIGSGCRDYDGVVVTAANEIRGNRERQNNYDILYSAELKCWKNQPSPPLKAHL